MEQGKKSKKGTIERWITNNPITINKKENVLTTIKMMAANNIDTILITEDRKLLGIFTESDILRFFRTSSECDLHLPIESFMTPNPLCAQITDSYKTVYTKMLDNNIKHVPILKDEELIGLVSIKDLINFYHNKVEAVFIEAKREFEKLESLLRVSGNEKIESLMQEIKKYKKLSLCDDLTGLYNRRYIESRVKEEVARAKRYNSCFSLIFCDIDSFKHVNDSYGHDCGDHILRELARLLLGQLEALNSSTQLRKSDIVARYGGEEFIIFLPQTRLDGAQTVANRLREEIEKSIFTYQDQIIKITLSFGISEFNKTITESSELIKKADKAMYIAKQKGSNRVETSEN